jgi:hypothetical protein
MHLGDLATAPIVTFSLPITRNGKAAGTMSGRATVVSKKAGVRDSRPVSLPWSRAAVAPCVYGCVALSGCVAGYVLACVCVWLTLSMCV